MSEVKVWCIV